MTIDQLPKFVPADGNKMPLYVQVFDVLYTAIKNGASTETGQTIPGENVLSKHLKVSRSTVHRALKRLEEEGIIYQSQGQETVIIMNPSNRMRGIEKISNVCTNCCLQTIDKIEIKTNLQPSGLFMTQLFAEKRSFAMAVVDSAYRCGSEVAAASVTLFPIEVLQTNNVNINDINAVLQFTVHMLYSIACSSEATLSVISADAMVSDKLGVEKGYPPLFLLEKLFDAKGQPLASVKSYLKQDFYRLDLNRRANQSGG